MELVNIFQHERYILYTLYGGTSWPGRRDPYCHIQRAATPNNPTITITTTPSPAGGGDGTNNINEEDSPPLSFLKQ